MSNFKNIIQVTDGIPVFENPLGCRLVPAYTDKHWGIGTFYLNGRKLGATLNCFLREETTEKCFRASKYEIMENTGERGTVRFSGEDGKILFHVDVTLTADSFAYTIAFEIDAMHPIYHSVFGEVPFSSSQFDFVKYPFEDTITPDVKKRFVVETDISRAPFIFGCEKMDGENCFVGVGYNLTDKFYEGRIEFDPYATPDAPLRIFSLFKGMARDIDLQCITKLELLRVDLTEEQKKSIHRFRYIVTTAKSQYDCIRSYAAAAEYDTGVKIEYSADNAIELLMKLYKTTPGYVEGKGYHQLIRVDTGDFDTTVPHGWYSKYLSPGPQLQLGFELYQYWKKNRKETWARDRAMEMCEFLISQQNPDGSYGNWDTDIGGTGMLHPDNTKGAEGNFNNFIYNTSDISIGSYYLYKLYDDVKATEGIVHDHWKSAAQLCIRYVAGLAGEDGSLGRNYSTEGGYDKIGTALAEVFYAMDYMYEDTGDKELHSKKLKIENWMYDNYLRQNNWADGCIDGGAWIGTDWPPPHNNDSVGIQPFVSYCAEMYRKYHEERYLQMAKDIFMYQWTISIPIQIPGFKHSTRGLMREQDFYSAFDLPIKINDYIDCLPYLSKVTGDPFFMEYFRIIIQTEIDYQDREKDYAGMHIGLQCDYTGRNPVDKVAERYSTYIVRFASMFIKSLRGPIAYQYVGGEGWGLGRDYNLPFDPDMGEGNPYVLCSTAMIRDVSWSPDSRNMDIFAYDLLSDSAQVEVKWNPDRYPIEKTAVGMNGKILPAADFYNPQTQVLTLFPAADAPSKIINIQCK